MNNPDRKVFKYEGETGVFFTKKYIDSILREAKNYLEVKDVIFEKIDEGTLQVENLKLVIDDRGTEKIGPYSFIVTFYKKDVDEYLTHKEYSRYDSKVNSYIIWNHMYVPIKTDNISFTHYIPPYLKGISNLDIPVSEFIHSLHNILEISGVCYKNYLDELYKFLLDISKDDRCKKNKIEVSRISNAIAITCNGIDYILAIKFPNDCFDIVNGSISVTVYEITQDPELEKYKARDILEQNLPLTYGKMLDKYSLEELMDSIIKMSN